MFTLTDASPAFVALDSQCKKIAENFFCAADLAREIVLLEADREVVTRARDERALYRIIEGSLRCSWGGKLLFFLNEGDLAGTEQFVAPAEFVLQSDFAVRAERVLLEDLYKRFQLDQQQLREFNRILSMQSLRYTALLAMFSADEVVLSPTLKTYSRGEVIIAQGAEASEVYSLADGIAEASVDGVTVGEIGPDEIFGTIAVLTNSKRTTSVVAKTNCTVLAVPRTKFIELIQAKPAVVLKMVEDMSKHIVALNSQLVGATLRGRGHFL